VIHQSSLRGQRKKKKKKKKKNKYAILNIGSKLLKKKKEGCNMTYRKQILEKQENKKARTS
jgi:hypothetical protein